jgi:hypothetical protein
MSENLERLQQSAAEAEEKATKFERLHAEATIKRELTQAAEEGGAHNSLQLLPYLLPAAKLVEVDGQQMVRIVKTDETGQETMFTPKEAVAHLKQINDLGNLFKTEPAATPAPAKPSKIDWSCMSHEQYLTLRAKLGLGPKRR